MVLTTKYHFGFAILVASVVLLTGCNTKPSNTVKINLYSGPVISANNVETLYSDSATLKIKMLAPRQLEYNDGDREFPNGIMLEFYKDSLHLDSRLTANYARTEKTSDIYLAQGNVIIINPAKKQNLHTEELFWNKTTKRVYTDKFVRVETEKEVLTGMGLEAAQDFSWYKIIKPNSRFATNSVL